MPNYITRPGGHDTTYPGPYIASGVDLRLYILPASFTSLGATLDRYLNAVVAPPAQFIPLGGRVIAVFAAMERVEGTDPRLGYMREIDVAFFIPAVRFEGLIPTEICFFAPYLFVDVPQAMATGREVHGYRKDLGRSFSSVDTFAAGWAPNAADLTHVEAWTVAHAGDRLQPRRLVNVQAPPAPPAPVTWPDTDATLAEFVGELCGSTDTLVTALRATGGGGGGLLGSALRGLVTLLFSAMATSTSDIVVPIAFLRQFRASYDSAQADVQAVLRADTRIPLAKITGKKLPGAYALTFDDTVSHPMSTELGLPNLSPVTSSLTLEAHCDFVLEHTS